MEMLQSLLFFLAFAFLGIQAQTVPCPNSIPTAGAFPQPGTFSSLKTLPNPFTYLASTRNVASKDEWYQCRQPEILALLQEYHLGWYPNRDQETVSASRSGNTITVTVQVGTKRASFPATVSVPTGNAPAGGWPVVISIGSMGAGEYNGKGVAVVVLDYTKVSTDSTAKSGAFFTLYQGRDIGTLMAWAWGVHRTIEALAITHPGVINTLKVGVTGCSRLGKAALVAGIFSPNVTLTMPMSSGIQGLGPYRYHGLSGQDETLENSFSGAGWWSSTKLGQWRGITDNLPWDAHLLAAAIAPKALVIDQGNNDPYTNSKGVASIVYPAAKVVYDWLGVGDNLAMAVRTGGHCDASGNTNVLPFVEKILKGTVISRNYTDIKPFTVMKETFPWAAAVPST